MPIQIVGLSCEALCDRKIVADPDGRICPGCGSVFHTSCIESKSCPDCHITIESAVSHDATRASYVAVYHPERPWSVTLVGRLVCIGSIAIPFDFATSSTNTDSTVDFCGFPLPISMRWAVMAIIEGVILFAIGISILDGSNRVKMDLHRFGSDWRNTHCRGGVFQRLLDFGDARLSCLYFAAADPQCKRVFQSDQV